MAVEALRRERIPFISVLCDPTYGGVSASYAMEADVRVAVAQARIGFAGPQVCGVMRLGVSRRGGRSDNMNDLHAGDPQHHV